MIKTNIFILILCVSVGLLTDKQKTIAIVISAEACGEGEKGMLAVADTIQNRMELKNKSAFEIVTEPHQYKGLTSKTRYKRYEECKDIALELTKNLGSLEDITNGALYFKRPEEKRQLWHEKFTVKIGNHEFYK